MLKKVPCLCHPQPTVLPQYEVMLGDTANITFAGTCGARRSAANGSSLSAMERPADCLQRPTLGPPHPQIRSCKIHAQPGRLRRCALSSARHTLLHMLPSGGPIANCSYVIGVTCPGGETFNNLQAAQPSVQTVSVGVGPGLDLNISTSSPVNCTISGGAIQGGNALMGTLVLLMPYPDSAILTVRGLPQPGTMPAASGQLVTTALPELTGQNPRHKDTVRTSTVDACAHSQQGRLPTVL